MFLTAKIVALFAQPLNWAIAFLVLGQLLPRSASRWRARCQSTALGILLCMGWQPLSDSVYRQLEQQYAEFAPSADLAGFEGVVVLGGALDFGYVAIDRLQPELNGAAERMTAASSLARQYPHLHMVFTGGEGQWQPSGPTEAQRAAKFFAAMGLTDTRFAYEDQSRTTYENAIFTAQLPGIDTRKRWLLLTSAWHMPRAMATFQKAGWNVTAYPVDFRTGHATPWTTYSPAIGAERWQIVLREYLGIVAYRLTGRI